MKSQTTRLSWWLMIVVCLVSVAVVIKGCHQHHSPVSPQQQGVSLKIAPDALAPQAKIRDVTVKAEGLDKHGMPNGNDLVEQYFDARDLPFDVLLMLPGPPYQWRITVTITLMRDAPLVAWVDLDLRQQDSVELTFNTFEELLLPEGSDPLHVPASVEAGETITASCGPMAVSAPDADRAPVVATLREFGGNSISGPISDTQAVSGSFPDPYPLDSPATSREFICVIADGHSPNQTFTKGVQRIVPTPTPTVTPTPTPTPDPCQVTTNNDSGADSLRQVLADALANGCSTITFAAGVSTITLTSGQLTVPAMTVTIDGGSGVTVSGNNSSRVFWVNNGANVTFAGLTITQGNSSGAGRGGGIYNDWGTVTIASNTIVSGNSSGGSYCGGIINNGGTITVNGTVSANTTNIAGGGIGNSTSATLIINGTVSNNTSSGNAGGILNSGILIVNGTVSGNMANLRGGGIYNNLGTVTLNPGNLIQGNHCDNDDSGGETGGGFYMVTGACPVPDANYGSGNYRGSGTGTIDNCSP